MNKKEYSGYFLFKIWEHILTETYLSLYSTVGDLSPEQELALKKFRAEVQAMGIPDDKFDDCYLLRFLRARKFDLAKTKEMWVNFIQWRKENNVDEIGVKISIRYADI